MMDQIASLMARGLVSPDAANALAQQVSYWQNKGIQPPIIEGGGAGTRLGATTTREPLLGYSKPKPSANENMTYGQFQKSVPRLDALNKLIENKDFKPSLVDGKMKFKSLTRDENAVMNKIGYGRSPEVTHEMEQSDPANSWEKNIRYWHGLETPSKE